MSTIPKRCLTCGRLTSGGSYCDQHTRAREQQRNRSPAQQARLSISREQRRRILQRDQHRCRHCGTYHDLTLDHVTPLARTPVKAWVRDDDLQTLCRSCNSQKGARHSY